MNILIVYTPRSKSTFIHDVLAKKFSLDPLGDLLTKTRINSSDDLTSLLPAIEKINFSNNICLKINGHDFIDLKNKKVVDLYKLIDYNKFDHIIFLTRENFTDALLSYGYMDRYDSNSWHKRTGSTIPVRMYNIPTDKIYFLGRGYRVYEIIKDYITKNSLGKIHSYEFETVESQLSEDFTLDNTDFVTSTEPNNIDYQQLLTNQEVLSEITNILKTMHTVDVTSSEFWQGLP